ncbi:MAG TPA: thiamine pyrophosphate-dependent enzyme [Pirellulales bacterium]|nr:thiamine pyrophosphate-dependent enzyme [Pirellulales bacterium]
MASRRFADPALFPVPYSAMVAAREIDRVALDLIRRGRVFFNVSGAGCEATACLARHLRSGDWLRAQYRDKALLLACGVPVEECLARFFCPAGPHGDGPALTVHFLAPGLNVLGGPGPAGNQALRAVDLAAALARGGNAIVVCSMAGDGKLPEGDFLMACAKAVRARLPVLFLIESHRGSDSPECGPDEFYGLPVLRVDAADVLAVDVLLGGVVERIRADRSPAIVALDVPRVVGLNGPDRDGCHDLNEVIAVPPGADPLRRSEDYALECGASVSELRRIRAEIATDVEAAAARALARRDGPAPQ